MKFLLATALLVAGTAVASAQPAPWSKEAFPYAKKHHSVCQDKAQRLRSYEMRAKADGRLTKRERDTMRTLERDLDRTCGRFRMKS